MAQKPTNGVLNIDTKKMEEMRAQVVEQELSARSWKAYWEKMYYSMEAEKLEPAYKEYKERMAKRLEEEKKQYEDFIEKMNKEMEGINATNPNGELSIEPVATETPVINIDSNK